MKNRKKIFLRLELENEDAEEFELLKENLGAKRDSDTVRVALKQLNKTHSTTKSLKEKMRLGS